MITRTTVLRVLFLFTAFLAYGQPSYAAYPSWQLGYCNSYCTGERRVHECEYSDSGPGTYWDASSVCNVYDECVIYGMTCYYPGQTEQADEHWGGWCASQAAGAGDFNPWYTGNGCYGYDGTAEGAFYCSYTDLNTCYS